MLSDRLAVAVWGGAMKNKNLPKTPQIWVNGRRYRFRPECAECGLIADEPRPEGWKYLNHYPCEEDDWGYLCPHCLED